MVRSMVLLVLLVVLVPADPNVSAQASQGQAGQELPRSTLNISLDGIPQGAVQTPDGSSRVLTQVPTAPARPPIVLLVVHDDARAQALAARLAAAGVASVRADTSDPRGGFHTPDARYAPMSALTLAHWVVHFRNLSDKFPTVTMFTEGPLLHFGVIAARAGRVDGLITDGSAAGESADELKRMRAATAVVSPRSVEEDALAIADFARTVAAYGRRGGPAGRSAQARRSPRQVVLTKMGDVRIGVEWGSPQKRGREVWGSLVKWDAVWMPGADEATTLTTDGPITLSVPGMASLKVPAGDHTIYTLPRAGRFELIVSKDTGQFHTVHAAELELGRIVMQRRDRAEAMEGLTFAIEPKDSGAELKLIWDQREYSVQVTTNK